MINRKSQLQSALFTGTLLVVLDQICKNWAIHMPNFSVYIISPWLGWEFFKNPGVAFGIPISGWIMTIITPPIVFGLAILLNKKYSEPKTSSHEIWGLSLIILGATSNFIDRLLLNYTADYIRILYSVINIADVMIICGLFCLLKGNRLIDKTS